MQMPAYTIAHNAGLEGAVVVGKLLEQSNPNMGYDCAKGLFAVLDDKPLSLLIHLQEQNNYHFKLLILRSKFDNFQTMF